MQITTLAKRNQTLNNWAQFLCLGQCGHDLLMLNQRLSHISEQHLAVL
jgi:hypothetical protein